MKKIFKISGLMIFVILLTHSSLTIGQGMVEISPFGGYMFGGSLNCYEGKIKVDNNANYGVAVDFKVAKDTQLELMWTQMNTSGRFEPYYGYLQYQGEFDMNVGYIQIGSVREFDMDNVKPFGVFSLGTTYFIPKDVTFDDDSYFSPGTTIDPAWKFSMILGGGAKIWLSDRVGIRLQGNLMLPMFWSSTGFAIGTGGGGFYVGGGTSMVQGDFTGGLIFALGD